MAKVKLGSLVVGQTVKINVSGTARDFIVNQQGKPKSNLYDGTCDGTWLLLQEPYEHGVKWKTAESMATYETSNIHKHLTQQFLSTLDSSVVNIINGSNFVFRNKVAQNGAAFSFRVKAKRGASDAEGFITSISGVFQ